MLPNRLGGELLSDSIKSMWVLLSKPCVALVEDPNNWLNEDKFAEIKEALEISWHMRRLTMIDCMCGQASSNSSSLTVPWDLQF